MIVHQVKIGERKPVRAMPARHKTIYVTSAQVDLKYRDMLVYFRQRWEFYIHGSLGFSTCDREGVSPIIWKQTAEKKIQTADGVFMLVSEYTSGDPDALWEIDRALANQIPIAGVDIRNRFKGEIPETLAGRMTRYGWEWFAAFINTL